MFTKIIISLLIALLFSINPLPDSIESFRPLFALLVCLYWTIYHNRYFGLLHVFIVGILLDVLYGNVLGQNAFCLVIAIALSLFYQRAFRLAPIFQQILFIALFAATYQFLHIWIDSILDLPVEISKKIIVIIISALLWPAIVILIDKFLVGKIKTQNN